MVKRAAQILLFLILSASLSGAMLPPERDGKPSSKTAEPCGSDPAINAILAQTSAEDWAGWIARLSGQDPVILTGKPTFILTRTSYAMFRGESNARGYEYVSTRLREWYPADQIEEDTFTPAAGVVWKNIILTLPGTTDPDEVIILSAHLDSISDNAEFLAPGAEDNATGSAALLEAARIFRTWRFARTLRLIWFTGEEQGLLGSEAYVQDHDLSGVVGVINLDMYGYDPNNDGCFELHIGTMAESVPIGACFRAAAAAYSPALKVDAVDAYDMRFSDHNSFWEEGLGAVEVLENFSSGQITDACGGHGEHSPYYHKTTDTLDRINLSTGFAITRASLAAAAGLAQPAEACFSSGPRLSVSTAPFRSALTWTEIPGASRYQVYRSDAADAGETPLCSAEWLLKTETRSLSWNDYSVQPGKQYAYRVEAMSANGGCVSAPSSCTILQASKISLHLPWFGH